MALTDDKPVIRLLKALGKLVLGLVVLYVILVLALFGPILFHDEEQIDEAAVNTLLQNIALKSEEVTITHRYTAPANWAGDYSWGFCVVMAASNEPTDRFQPGHQLEPSLKSQLESFGNIARLEMPWLKSPEDLLTEHYLIADLRPDLASTHIAYLHQENAEACYFAIKF